MATQIPLCRDCAHCIVGDTQSPYQYAKCERSTYISLVTGETVPYACADARGWGMNCGPDGRLFLSNDAFDGTGTGEPEPAPLTVGA